MVQVNIIGNLTADAEIKTSQDTGTKFLQGRIAAGVGRDDDTEFYAFTAFGNFAAKNFAQYMTKGRQVFISGELRVRVHVSPDTGKTYINRDVVVRTIQLIGPRPKCEKTIDNA